MLSKKESSILKTKVDVQLRVNLLPGPGCKRRRGWTKYNTRAMQRITTKLIPYFIYKKNSCGFKVLFTSLP